jgi:hypothetical protein
MTVQELIDLLSEVDPSLEVQFFDGDPVEDIEIFDTFIQICG